MPKPGRNWPLIVGAILVGAIALLALWGPALAPHDPLQAYYITQVDGRWIRAPYPPFTVPDFPLGSDRFGRDLWSRLLHAVRPTLGLIALAGLIRLAIGAAIGIAAGWAPGRAGRWLDTVIAAALAAPVLVVALGAVAWLGRQLGPWAFVVGLTVTGWGDTARMLREQTNILKGQPYIEAARALGQSGLRIAWRHVLPQVAPLGWMLAAFEVGAALATLAGLGFLGYYVGGTVWVMVGDFVASRATGMPELGEMLASSAGVLDRQPWSMLAVGAVVFATILGFNLLGDGLRRQLEVEARRRDSAYARLTGMVGERIETGVLAPLSARIQRRAFRVRALAAAAVIALAAGALAVWAAQADRPAHQALSIPGGHVWASEARDAQGTHTVDYAGPLSPTVGWTFRDPSGFSGGPAVGANGLVYAASLSGTLHALGVSGQAVWTATLPAQPVGGPAIGPGGDLYVADAQGGLSAFDARGAPLWRQAPAAGEPGAGAPAIAGPIVSADGVVYYPSEGYLQAVDASGRLLWRAQAPYSYFNPSPRLSADGSAVFFKDVAYDARDGQILVKESVNPLDHFIAAADGRVYLLTEKALLEWRSTEQGVAIVQVAPMDYERQFPGTPVDGGVMTERRLMWLFFSNEYQDTRALWMELSGRVTGAIGIRYRSARVAGVDRDATLYVCGTVGSVQAACAAYAPNTDEPLWTLNLMAGTSVRGAALAPDRLYVTTAEGGLYALKDLSP